MSSQTWEYFLLQTLNLDLIFIIIILQKANRLIGLIKKSFEFLDAPMLPTLYTSLVHPYLDYACVVWCPFQLGDIRIIEKVQRRATKIIPSLKDMIVRCR